MENDTELNCLKAASKKENTRVPTAAIGESNRLHNIFSASQEEQQPERHLCCISNISVTGGDLQGGQGKGYRIQGVSRHSSLVPA